MRTRLRNFVRITDKYMQRLNQIRTFDTSERAYELRISPRYANAKVDAVSYLEAVDEIRRRASIGKIFGVSTVRFGKHKFNRPRFFDDKFEKTTEVVSLGDVRRFIERFDNLELKTKGVPVAA